jgi:hypothetical protein
MKSSGTSEFWQLYRELPEPIRQSARRTYRLWDENPRAPALRIQESAASRRLRATDAPSLYRSIPRLRNPAAIVRH